MKYTSTFFIGNGKILAPFQWANLNLDECGEYTLTDVAVHTCLDGVTCVYIIEMNPEEQTDDFMMILSKHETITHNFFGTWAEISEYFFKTTRKVLSNYIERAEEEYND